MFAVVTPMTQRVALTLLPLWLAACASLPVPPQAEPVPPPVAEVPRAPEPEAAPLPWPTTTAAWMARADQAPLPPPLLRKKSRWVPVRWSELPGFTDDSLTTAWVTWRNACERPAAGWEALCKTVRELGDADEDAQRQWMLRQLQPYRVEALSGEAEGLLTGYFEPVLDARRRRGGEHQFPVYRLPANLNPRRPWFSRHEMDTHPEARRALRDCEIAWLADPVDALVLQLQGSGRLRVTEPDGRTRLLRVSFAGTNAQPARSTRAWYQAQGGSGSATWQDLRRWVAGNMHRAFQLIWSNPQTVFFQDRPVRAQRMDDGPSGAQGVTLTAQRSVAVDRDSIPFGTPLWLASEGAGAQLQRLVFAQDTGGGISGAVRADLFMGSGDEAGEQASRLRQPLQLWALWPRQDEEWLTEAHGAPEIRAN